MGHHAMCMQYFPLPVLEFILIHRKAICFVQRFGSMKGSWKEKVKKIEVDALPLPLILAFHFLEGPTNVVHVVALCCNFACPLEVISQTPKPS